MITQQTTAHRGVAQRSASGVGTWLLRGRSALGLLMSLLVAPLGCGDDETSLQPDGTGAAGGAGGASVGGAGGVGGTTGGEGGGTTGGLGGGGGSGGGFVVDTSIEGWHSRALLSSVHFAPEEDLERIVLDQLATAQTSLRLAFFNLRLDEVRDLLAQKVSAGVDVQVILDAKTQALEFNTMGEELTNLGVTVTLVTNSSAEQATMHNKFTIIDGVRVLTGSANYSVTALNISDEDLLVFDNAEIAARYQTEFDELLGAAPAVSPPYPVGADVQAWMGPEDDLDGKLSALLDGAVSNASIALFQLNASQLETAILDAHVRGVNVVVFLDANQANLGESTSDETLTAAGVPVILADNMGSAFAEMHSKFLVVDHQTAVLGSMNWTNLGSFFNDENIVIVSDPQIATRVEGKFASLLNTYPSPTPAELGLTTGPQAVTFNVSNVKLDSGAELVLRSVNGGPFPNGTTLTATSLSTDIAAGTTFEYQYEIVVGGATVSVESEPRLFTVPYAPGPFAIVDAYAP